MKSILFFSFGGGGGEAMFDKHIKRKENQREQIRKKDKKERMKENNTATT